jgi:hypothetical protein
LPGVSGGGGGGGGRRRRRGRRRGRDGGLGLRRRRRHGGRGPHHARAPHDLGIEAGPLAGRAHLEEHRPGGEEERATERDLDLLALLERDRRRVREEHLVAGGRLEPQADHERRPGLRVALDRAVEHRVGLHLLRELDREPGGHAVRRDLERRAAEEAPEVVHREHPRVLRVDRRHERRRRDLAELRAVRGVLERRDDEAADLRELRGGDDRRLGWRGGRRGVLGRSARGGEREAHGRCPVHPDGHSTPEV